MADFTLKPSEGLQHIEGTRVAIVVTRWNDHVTRQLLKGALDACTKMGLSSDHLDVVWCPGAFEIPLTAKMLLKTGKYHGLISLGAVIRGSTPHFEYVSKAVTDGVLQVMLEFSSPIAFGVLTVDTEEQALERADTDRGNKGYEAAITLFEMIALSARIAGGK
jgi:6,7-dimethyl-8-ribityllumazine synthase